MRPSATAPLASCIDAPLGVSIERSIERSIEHSITAAAAGTEACGGAFTPPNGATLIARSSILPLRLLPKQHDCIWLQCRRHPKQPYCQGPAPSERSHRTINRTFDRNGQIPLRQSVQPCKAPRTARGQHHVHVGVAVGSRGVPPWIIGPTPPLVVTEAAWLHLAAVPPPSQATMLPLGHSIERSIERSIEEKKNPLPVQPVGPTCGLSAAPRSRRCCRWRRGGPRQSGPSAGRG